MAFAFVAPFIWLLIAPDDLATEVAAFITLGEAIAVPVVWYFGPGRHRSGWKTLGFRRARLEQFLLGCTFLLAMFMFNYVFSLFLLLFDTSIQPGLNAMIADARFPLWLIGASVLVAPISEEILFRGFVFGGLEARYGWKKAAFFSSLIFAGLHFQPTAFLPLLFIGLLLCLLYYWTDSLWPGVIVHASMNLLAVLGALLLSYLEGIQ
jgi:membrane protease YdiL (CAAX protease family)